MYTSELRTSELYKRYFDEITVIAKSRQMSLDWEPAVERVVRRFHTETMSMLPTCFQKLRDDMSTEFDEIARTAPDARGEDIFSHVAKLLSELK